MCRENVHILTKKGERERREEKRGGKERITNADGRSKNLASLVVAVYRIYLHDFRRTNDEAKLVVTNFSFTLPLSLSLYI